MKVEQSTLPCKGCLPQEGVQACGRLVLHNNKEALSSLHQDGSDKLYTELQEATIERKKVSKSNPNKRRKKTCIFFVPQKKSFNLKIWVPYKVLKKMYIVPPKSKICLFWIFLGTAVNTKYL